MTDTPYTPREGTVPARVIAHLQANGGSIDSAGVAALLQIARGNVYSNLAVAVKHGLLVRDGITYQLAGAGDQSTWGDGGRPAFPAAPPRAGEPVKAEKQPRKMRTLKEVAREFHREKAAVPSSRSVVVAIKAPPATTTALAVPSNEPASLRQIGGTHYKQMAVQPWDVVDDWPLEQRIGYYRGNALKYLMRMGSKDQDAQEIGKGRHYIEKLLEVLQEQDVQVAAT